MFYFRINHQQNVSDSNLDQIIHTTCSYSPTNVLLINYDVGQAIESP
jgi:hypothetical protein